MALTPDQLSRFRGHPTAGGVRDEKETLGPSQEVRDGRPGKPKTRLVPEQHGPGIPGPTPAGPLQPGSDYDDTAPSTPDKVLEYWKRREEQAKKAGGTTKPPVPKAKGV